MAIRPKGVQFGSELTGYRRERCSICIVGSGPGGANAADELTRAGHDVLIIEEGPLAKPGASLSPDEAMLKYYTDSGFFATHWPIQVPIPTGRVFGGGSVINSGTCFHTPDNIIDGWEQNLGVTIDRKAWRGIEAELDADLSIRPCPMEIMSRSNQLFHEGLIKRGLKPGQPLSRCENGCDGNGLCCFVCPNEAKQAMHISLLKRALDNGMRALVETRVTGLVQQGRRIKELICHTQAGGRLIVEADRFILAMGALYTPHFLMANGLHRGYKAVGRNLTIHPATKVFGQMEESVCSWKGVPQAYGYEHPDYPTIRFEGIFLPASLGAASIPFFGPELSEWMAVYDKLIAFGFCIADNGYGRLVRIPGINRPVIRYNLTPRDLDLFYFAIRFIAENHFAVGAKRVLLPIAGPCNVFNSLEELDRGFNRSMVGAAQVYGMAFHPLGSCRFAADKQRGVVDITGRCHDHDNLYILDGAAIPGPLGVNPQVTIMAFARWAARNMA